MTRNENLDSQILDEAQAIQLPVVLMTTLFRSPAPESLDHIPRPALDSAIILAIVCMKRHSLDLGTLERAGSEVQVPFFEVENFFRRNPHMHALADRDIRPFVDYLRDKVLTSPKYRTYQPIGARLASPNASKQFVISTVTEDAAALRPEVIMAFARLYDLVKMTGTDTLDYKTYQLQMMIELGDFDSVVSTLESIKEAVVGEFYHLINVKNAIRQRFQEVDFDELEDDLRKRADEYRRLFEKMDSSLSMLNKMDDRPEDDAAAKKLEVALDQARGSIKQCIDAFSTLATQCGDVIYELLEASKRNARYDISDLFDFEREVVERLGELSMPQIAELPQAILAPVCLSPGAKMLYPEALMDAEPARRKEANGGFVDMSGARPNPAALEAEEKARRRAEEASRALAEFIGRFEGDCLLSDALKDPRLAVEFAEPGVFGKVCLADALAGRLPLDGVEAIPGKPFVFAGDCIASDILFAKKGA